MIRRATESDVPFILAIAQERYPPFDLKEAAQWLRESMRNPEMLVVRSDHGFGICVAGSPFWQKSKQAHMLFLAVRRVPGLSRKGLQWGVDLILFMDHWRQTQGAHSFHFGEDTGANYKLLAKVLGATQARPAYRLGESPLSIAAEMFDKVERAKPDLRIVGALDQVFGVRA